jgi:hypothetical protein
MSEQRTSGRKAIILLAAVVLVCLTLWVARGASVLSGANPTPAETTAAHGDSDAAKGVTTTTPADQPPGK